VSDFYLEREVTLSGAAEVVTVQIPAGSTRNLKFKMAQVWCSTGSVDVTVERDGTAATTTALTPQKVNPNASWVPSSIASGFHTSNVGAGSQIGSKQTAYAGSTGLILDMSPTVLEKASASVRNLTIRTASYTGTVRISIFWEERVNL
jgi:hypothetical protein